MIKEEKETGKLGSKKTDGHIGELQNISSKLERQVEGLKETKREMDKGFKNEFRKISEQIMDIQ